MGFILTVIIWVAILSVLSAGRHLLVGIWKWAREPEEEEK